MFKKRGNVFLLRDTDKISQSVSNKRPNENQVLKNTQKYITVCSNICNYIDMEQYECILTKLP